MQDRMLERHIERYKKLLVTAEKHSDRQRIFMRKMYALIKKRSAVQVRKMEVERGLS